MTPTPAPPAHLAERYAHARAGFLAAARQAGAALDHYVHPLRGRDDEELAIDVARLGAADADEWLVVVSATHGVEGYCGSALQTRLLELVTSATAADHQLGVVLVHGLNPHGFSWERRVNEDNIDLNRNFIDWAHPPPHNTAYDDLASLLVPANWDDASQTSTLSALAERAATLGFDQFQEDVTSGQYHHPTGLFYGGQQAAWSNDRIVEIWRRHLADAKQVTVIDLHTGLGPWGHGELITNELAGPDYDRATARWGEVHSTSTGDSVSAELQGDWLSHLHTWSGDAEVTAVALEYGTIDIISVLTALRADAWLHATTGPVGPRGDEIRSQVRNAFADDDPAWIAACWTRFVEVLAPVLPLH